MLHIPIEHADDVYKLFLIPRVVVSLAILSLLSVSITQQCTISVYHVFYMELKFKRKRLNLLTDSKGKRWVLLLLSSPRAVRAMAWDHSLQSCFLSITIFRHLNMDFTIILEYTFSQFRDKNIRLTVRKKIYSGKHWLVLLWARPTILKFSVNCCIDRFDTVIKQLVHAAAVGMSRYWALGKFGEHSRS